MGSFFYSLARKTAAIFLLFASVVILLVSCSASPSAEELMMEFAKAYGIDKTCYSKSIPEGEPGYAPVEFFTELYGNIEESVSDYAVIFTSTLSSVGECSVILCYSEYDAMRVSEAALMRLDMIKSLVGSVNTEAADDAFVIRRGRAVITCALSDNERAEKLWKKII